LSKKVPTNGNFFPISRLRLKSEGKSQAKKSQATSVRWKHYHNLPAINVIKIITTPNKRHLYYISFQLSAFDLFTRKLRLIWTYFCHMSLFNFCRLFKRTCQSIDVYFERRWKIVLKITLAVPRFSKCNQSLFEHFRRLLPLLQCDREETRRYKCFRSKNEMRDCVVF
jgi:hypothetical protein